MKYLNCPHYRLTFEGLPTPSENECERESEKIIKYTTYNIDIILLERTTLICVGKLKEVRIQRCSLLTNPVHSHIQLHRDHTVIYQFRYHVIFH